MDVNCKRGFVNFGHCVNNNNLRMDENRRKNKNL